MSRSKSKRRNRNANPVKQTQSPPASSSPSSRVTKPGQAYNNSSRSSSSNKHKKKKWPPESSVFKKHGLNPESPQAGSSNLSIKKDKPTKPSLNSSRAKVQEPGKSKETPLQHKRPHKVEKSHPVPGFEFQFKYKDAAQAEARVQALLQSQVSLGSPPSSPPKVERHKGKPAPGPESANTIHEDPSSNADSESEMGCEPLSPPEMREYLETAIAVSYRDHRHEICETLTSESTSKPQLVSPSEPERNSSMPLPALPERLLGHRDVTPSSRSGYEQQTHEESTAGSERGLSFPSPASPVSSQRFTGHRVHTPASLPAHEQQTQESSTWDIDNEPELSFEEESSSGREPALSSPSPWPMTALKRKRPSTHHGSRCRPFPIPSSPESLREFEPESMFPREFLRDLYSVLAKYTNSGQLAREIRRQPVRIARARKPFPFAPQLTTSQLNAEIGFETPSKAGSEHESFRPTEAGSESDFESDSESLDSNIGTTVPSSPCIPLASTPVISQVLPPSLPPKRWLSRLNNANEESSLMKTVWALRLRLNREINPPEAPLMIDGNKHPRLFAQFPPAARGNIEWMFPDDSDDSDFEPAEDDSDLGLSDDDIEGGLPTTKRPRLELPEIFSEQEDLLEQGVSLDLGSSTAEHCSETEQYSGPEQFPESEDLPEPGELSQHQQSSESEPSLGPVTSSEPAAVPELERPTNQERSSDPESEPRTPPSIRDELPTGLVRQLNKRIDVAIAKDKKEHPTHWGGSWMKEYERGVAIKERVEAQYREEIEKKKEDAERKKLEKQERDKKKKAEERKRAEEKKRQKEKELREETEEKKKKSLKEAEDKTKDVISELLELLGKENRKRTSIRTRSDLQGNQSKAQMERLKKEILSVMGES
ncbi:hypothetical protein PENCOP_c009G07718 [Penicillium coprophilum]|uniref:Uncharacterized protein n=1 Tax=Penicillium coprophilum TaxID=36646 RepID=A0A1V6UHG9_9EURO|nr:hypothetical protein PENCOP_c009G07718 [Penicillium coprophilum]